MHMIQCYKFLIIACVLWFSSATLAQNEPGLDLLLNPEAIELSQPIRINDSYTQKWGGNAPAPFQLQVPILDDASPLYHPPEEGFDTLLRVSFVTDDQQLIENIRFTPMILSMGPLEQQLQTMADLLRDEVFPTFTNGYANIRYVGTRSTKIHSYDAVELVGSYIDPDFGLMYLRIVGIINPDSEHTVFAIANVVDEKIRLTSPEQYAQTRGGIMLEHFQFLIE